MAKRPKKPSKSYYAPSQGAMRRMQDALVIYDEKVNQIEREWGVDRLPWLAGLDLRLRFNEQLGRLNAAIDEMVDVEHQVDVTLRGLAVMEYAAVKAGFKPLSGDYIEAAMPDGSVMAIVPNDYEVFRVKQDNPTMRVYSANEVAQIISGFEEKAATVNAVKDVFPGAVVEKVKTKLEKELNDEIPF